MEILKKITEEENYLDILNSHHLSGFFYSKMTQDKLLKKDYLRNIHRNSLYLEECEKIVKIINNRFKIILLKGLSFIGNIYQDMGERFMSDVDILVDKSNLPSLVEILKTNGYEELDSKKWFANDFKKVLSKKVEGLELVIELHTRLFYHSDIKLEVERMENGFFTLSKELQMVHLSGHLGFQHNFQKLYWLVDIFLFIEMNKETINWTKVYDLSKDLKVFKSVSICLWLVKTYFNVSLLEKTEELFEINKNSLWKKYLTYDFLISPFEISRNYLIMKHLNKDSFLENIKYNLGWIKKKILA